MSIKLIKVSLQLNERGDVRMMDIVLKKSLIQLLDDKKDVVIQNGILVEGNGLCAIYDMNEKK